MYWKPYLNDFQLARPAFFRGQFDKTFITVSIVLESEKKCYKKSKKNYYDKRFLMKFVWSSGVSVETEVASRSQWQYQRIDLKRQYPHDIAS